MCCPLMLPLLDRVRLEKVKVRNAPIIFPHRVHRHNAARPAELQNGTANTEGPLAVEAVLNVVMPSHHTAYTKLGPPVLEIALDRFVRVVRVDKDKIQRVLQNRKEINS
jgi:hypothetical protein